MNEKLRPVLLAMAGVVVSMIAFSASAENTRLAVADYLELERVSDAQISPATANGLSIPGAG